MTQPKQTKLKRRDIFKMLERDCVNPQTVTAVKDYIDRLVGNNHGGTPPRDSTIS